MLTKSTLRDRFDKMDGKVMGHWLRKTKTEDRWSHSVCFKLKRKIYSKFDSLGSMYIRCIDEKLANYEFETDNS